MIDAEKYFDQVDCPAIDCVSRFEIEKFCLHLRSVIDLNDLDVLSIGCADCKIEKVLFNSINPRSFTGIDFSNYHLSKAREKIPSAKFICADLKKDLPDLESYDVIYGFSIAQYFSHDELLTLHENMYQFLKPNGKLIYFNVPDERRKFLYRINKAIIMEDEKYLESRFDFVDDLSHWCARDSFRVNGYNTTFLTPSCCWERFDVIMLKKNP